MVRCVWALAKEETVEHIFNIQEQNPKAWLAAVISSLPREESRRTMVTLWALWHARRKAVYEDTFQSPLSTHNFVERFIADLDLSQPQPAARQITETRIPRWIPPPGGMSKLNVDAALSKNSRMASVAAVARDGAGRFLGASAVVMLGISDPETMEVLALREGLALANDLSLSRVRMTSDCANAVRGMAGSTSVFMARLSRNLRKVLRPFR